MAKLFGSYLALLSISSLCFLGVSAQQCSEETLCPNNQCCSIWGYCGTSYDHCCDHCLSQCTCNIRRPARNDVGVEGIVNEFMFNKMLPDRDSSPCVGHFYSYRAFREGAARFPEFGTTGDEETRKREVAAFLAQTSHATTGGREVGPASSYTRGYCWTREGRNADPSTLPSYCEKSEKWPCASGKKYYGRGPIQLSHNYNYGPAGEALGYDLLNYPEGVELDPYVAFETAFWFWMTPQPPKPSCHDVMTGNFTPSPADVAAGRVAGFGLCTNIINGGEDCGGGFSNHEFDRLGFYWRYCKLLEVDDGENTNCRGMKAYPDGHPREGARAGGGSALSQ